MGQQINSPTVKTWDNKIQFTGDEITITIEEFALKKEKNDVSELQTTRAYIFICDEKRYVVTNSDGILTIENWRPEELLPKFQVLKLLIAEIPEPQ